MLLDRALGKGVRPKIVQELLGHANISITLDTYSHVIPGMGNQTVDAMEEIFT
jgi:integrase